MSSFSYKWRETRDTLEISVMRSRANSSLCNSEVIETEFNSLVVFFGGSKQPGTNEAYYIAVADELESIPYFKNYNCS